MSKMSSFSPSNPAGYAALVGRKARRHVVRRVDRQRVEGRSEDAVVVAVAGLVEPVLRRNGTPKMADARRASRR